MTDWRLGINVMYRNTNVNERHLKQKGQYKRCFIYNQPGTGLFCDVSKTHQYVQEVKRWKLPSIPCASKQEIGMPNKISIYSTLSECTLYIRELGQRVHGRETHGFGMKRQGHLKLGRKSLRFRLKDWSFRVSGSVKSTGSSWTQATV